MDKKPLTIACFMTTNAIRAELVEIEALRRDVELEGSKLIIREYSLQIALENMLAKESADA